MLQKGREEGRGKERERRERGGRKQTHPHMMLHAPASLLRISLFLMATFITAFTFHVEVLKERSAVTRRPTMLKIRPKSKRQEGERGKRVKRH